MVFEYSYWWILLIICVASIVAYFKFKKLSKLPDIPKGVILLITSLRFLVVFVLLFLLLNPALSLLRNMKEKPLLIVAQDNSVSILKNKDSLYYMNEYKASLAQKLADLKNKFEVVELTFGQTVKRNGEIDFTDKRTDVSALLEYAEQNFMLRKPSGMILLTDGIYNTGVNPLYKSPSFPVYTVALGDTTSYPDVYIRNLETDKFNFLHTIFPMKVEVVALKEKGKKVKCVLRENGNIISINELLIDKDNFLSEVTFEVEAKRQGVIRYSVTLETDFSERSLENNSVETWVNIIDNSANIAIFTSAPHPDIAAIVNAVNVSGIYKCTEHRWDESMDTLKANLIILHNPDPKNPGFQKLMTEATHKKISIWNILTNRKSITESAQYNSQYTVGFTSDLNEYATPGMNREFPYFEFSDEEIAGFSVFPPLTVPFGEIRTGAGRVLFFQKIKNTMTSNGMLAFYDINGCRLGYLWGEGLWRWRLYSYLENGNHQLFNTLVNKIVGYLATRQGADRFIHDVKPLYDETEEVIVNAELYNESYELVNTTDVKLDLALGENKFNYLLGKNGDKYRLNLGNLPAGEYTYQLSANLKGENFTKKGVFYVRSHNPELNDIVAKTQLLKELADNTRGQIVYPSGLDELVDTLNKNNELKPVYKSEIAFIELRGMGVLGLILLLLLCTEWFLLKFYAG